MPKDETTKPDTSRKGESKGEDDEEHPQDALRREGLRLFPGAQTQQLDTTEGGGVTDVRKISPVFEEARQHAARAAAAAADADYGDEGAENVVFPDDTEEADLAREHARKVAAELPEEPDDRDQNLPDGMGGPYGQGVTPQDDGGAELAQNTVSDAQSGSQDKGDDAKSTGTKASSTTKAADTKAEDDKGTASTSKTATKSTSTRSTSSKTTGK